MKVKVNVADQEKRDEIVFNVLEDLKEIDSKNIEVSIAKETTKNISESELSKGDPVSVTTIILTLFGAGGAMTVAMGKHGLFSKIADVFESYISRKISIKIKTKDGDIIELDGPVKNIENIISKTWEIEKD
jgi:hypothetical protein